MCIVQHGRDTLSEWLELCPLTESKGLSVL